MNKKIATPMELSAIFASGAAKRASASHAIMAKYLPLKNGQVVWSACGNASERETIANLGYRQSAQTLAQWATVHAIIGALPKELRATTSLQADILAEYVFTLVTLRGSVAKRAELIEILPTNETFLELARGNAPAESNVKVKAAKRSARDSVNRSRNAKPNTPAVNSVDRALEIIDESLVSNSMTATQFKRLVLLVKRGAEQFTK